MADDIVDEIPNADVAEAKRGKWKDKQQTVRMGDMIITGTIQVIYVDKQRLVWLNKRIFAPNCGADMREINEKKGGMKK